MPFDTQEGFLFYLTFQNFFTVKLFHQNYQILAGAPEYLWVGNTQGILLVGVTYQTITA